MVFVRSSVVGVTIISTCETAVRDLGEQAWGKENCAKWAEAFVI